MKRLGLFFAITTLVTAGVCQSKDAVYELIGKRQKRFGNGEVTLSVDSQKAEYIRRYRQLEGPMSGKLDLEPAHIHVDPPRTRFETLAQRTHVSLIEAEAVGVLKKHAINPASVYFSSVPCPCFNAQSLPLRQPRKGIRDKWLIEYNIGFNLFANKAAVVTANLTPATGKPDSLSLEGWDYHDLLADPETTDTYKSAFSFLLADVASILNTRLDSITLENCKNPLISSALVTGFSMFTLYHELAHVILKHHAKVAKMTVGDGNSRVKVAVYQQLEYEADSLGMEIMFGEMSRELAYFDAEPTSAVFVPYVLSPLIFFSWLDLFQKFEDHTLGFHPGQSTHPPAYLRRQKMLTHYEKKGIKEEKVWYAKVVAAALDVVFKSSRNLLTKDLIAEIKKLEAKGRVCMVR